MLEADPIFTLIGLAIIFSVVALIFVIGLIKRKSLSRHIQDIQRQLKDKR